MDQIRLRPVRISRVQVSTLTFLRCFDNIGNNIDNACEKPVLFSPEFVRGWGWSSPARNNCRKDDQWSSSLLFVSGQLQVTGVSWNSTGSVIAVAYPLCSDQSTFHLMKMIIIIIMPSYYMTVSWRRRRRFIRAWFLYFFVLHSVFFLFPGNWVLGSKNSNSDKCICIVP